MKITSRGRHRRDGYNIKSLFGETIMDHQGKGQPPAVFLSSATGKAEKPQSTALPVINDKKDNHKKIKITRYESATDSSDELTSSSSETDTASHTDSEYDKESDLSRSPPRVSGHRYHGNCCKQFMNQLASGTTPVNRQVLSQLLKTLDREATFKNTLLDRQLNIIENALLDRLESVSSSDEEGEE